MQTNKMEKQERRTLMRMLTWQMFEKVRLSVGNYYQHTSSQGQNKLLVWKRSAAGERWLTVKWDNQTLSTCMTSSLCIEIPRVSKILSNTEEKEAERHSTSLIKDFNLFQLGKTAVMLKIWLQDVKKSLKLYIIHKYFTGEQMRHQNIN